MLPTVPQRAAGPLPPPDPRLVRLEGDRLLLDRLEEPLWRALSHRRAYYQVRIETVGRCGEILVSILGAKGQLPLIFGQEELEPGYVMSVVRDTVEKYGL
jgi:hypothetical protein